MFIVFIANRFTYTNANGQNDDLPCRKALCRALEPADNAPDLSKCILPGDVFMSRELMAAELNRFQTAKSGKCETEYRPGCTD